VCELCTSIAAGNALVKRIAPLARATARPGADAELGGFGGFFDPRAAGYRDPLLVAAQEGRGTVLCYTSDPAPHWGCNLVFWEKYGDFWLRCLDLVTSRR
jgi:phosphoribosylformylglycinamidine cyclo-ligase